MTVTEQSRERLGELLGASTSEAVTALADLCLADVPEDLVRIIRPAEVGVVATQVRDPLGHDRFLQADLLVTSAEVEVAGTRGWAMRSGEDLPGAMAQAVCDAEIARRGPHYPRIAAHCREVAEALAEQRAAEWSRLAPTIVEFEEIP